VLSRPSLTDLALAGGSAGDRSRTSSGLCFCQPPTLRHVELLTIVEKTNVRQSSRLSSALLQLIECSAILHNAVALLFRVAEEVDVVLAAGSGVRLGLEVAATATHEDIDLGTKWM
jgi:hypothetical protein